LLAYTDPATSSTGRSVLYTLYSIAAGKPLDQITPDDVNSPVVVDYVRQFQGLVDHYMSGTLPLNTKVYQGPRYGHFFLMPEDNLIHLYQGSESAFVNGQRVKAPPISRPMVMIYPKEGSTMHNHSASFVEAPWVTPEQREAAEKWVEYLLQDQRQRAFLAAGFRPATNVPVGDPISGRYGLDANKPSVVVNPDRIDQAAAAAIVESWDDVKRPGIVTFVVDTSGSMQGEKLQQAKDGLVRALDAMAKNNQVGLVTFSSGVNTRVPVAPLLENRFGIADAVRGMNANGGTALYDAVRAGIEMSDTATGPANAARSVVVLTDGRANGGKTGLHDLIQMTSRAEIAIRDFKGFESDGEGIEEGGRHVAKADLVGSSLRLSTRRPVQVFFIGIGKDADMDVGRMLSEATGAEFQGATEKDLANVLEEFSKYF
jgi:Ca-activated chloride channel family protein